MIITHMRRSFRRTPDAEIAQSDEFKAALQTGSWTPADVVFITNFPALADALFAAPRFDCNLALDAEGHTPLDLLLRRNNAKSTQHMNNTAVELLRARGAKTKAELASEKDAQVPNERSPSLERSGSTHT
jgi:hypothetical protein